MSSLVMKQLPREPLDVKYSSREETREAGNMQEQASLSLSVTDTHKRVRYRNDLRFQINFMGLLSLA